MAESPLGPTHAEPILVARAIRKAFGGVVALDGVDFVLRRSEIHGLVGQNGAGKSTLVKILNGVHRADAGSVTLRGEPISFDNPLAARRAGLAMVFQEFSLIPQLSVAQNVFLAHEPHSGPFIDDGAANRSTLDLLRRLGIDLDPAATVGSLPVGAQQLVEIAKAMSLEPAILILDEPTASLTHTEIETLFGVLRRLRDDGVSLIYITHHLNEVMEVCDAVTVLRDGRIVLNGNPREIALSALITAMTGAQAISLSAARFSEPTAAGGPTLFEVRNWTLGSRLQRINLQVRGGEVLGVAGLLGSGRTSLLRSFIGLEPGVTGEMLLGGERVVIDSPAAATSRGLAYVPEDRRREGVIVGQSVESNLLLSVWPRLTIGGLIQEKRARSLTSDLISRLQIGAAGRDQLIEYLSGGNQQKVVVGRTLALEPRLLLLDDPTAGIDIGSRRELLGYIRAFADEGHGVILVSSELDELGEVCDRVAILWRGKVVTELTRSRKTMTGPRLLAAIQSGTASGSPLGADMPAV